MKRFIGAVLVVLLFSGCATQTFIVNPGGGEVATLDQSQPFFIGGIGQSSTVDAAAICGGSSQIAKIETEESALDVLLGYITGSIYSPRTARVYCL